MYKLNVSVLATIDGASPMSLPRWWVDLLVVSLRASQS